MLLNGQFLFGWGFYMLVSPEITGRRGKNWQLYGWHWGMLVLQAEKKITM
jgi:hypothetical protein